MPPTSFLQIEAAIARAHRQLWSARSLADELQLDGLEQDLNNLCVELQRIQVDLLHGRKTLRKTLINRA